MHIQQTGVAVQWKRWVCVFCRNDAWLTLGMQACSESQPSLFIRMWLYMGLNCIPFILCYNTTKRTTKAPSFIFLFTYINNFLITLSNKILSSMLSRLNYVFHHCIYSCFNFEIYFSAVAFPTFGLQTICCSYKENALW